MLVLLLPATALALPSTSTITGTMVTSSGAACGGCKLTIRTPFTQNVDGGSFPAGEQRTWTMEADGDLPSGVTSTQGLWVEITMQKADPFTVQIPASASTTLQALIAAGASPPAGGTSADITAVWSCSSGDCSNLTAASGDSLNAEGADSTAPCKSGTSTPASCQVGDCFFDTDATAGQNLNVCTATNTWTQISGGGGSGDIEAVWSTTSGTVDALTAASGDSFNAGSADSSIPVTKSTSVAGTCTEGQLHQDTNSGGTELYICTATNTWAKVPSQIVFDVRDYGAVPDTGDDTTAVQAAIDDAEVMGGIVWFGPGNWAISSVSVAPSSSNRAVRLVGAAKGISNSGTQIDCSGSSGTCITFSTNCYSCGIEALSLSGAGGTLTFVEDTSTAGSSYARDVALIGGTYCVGFVNVERLSGVDLFSPIAGASCRGVSSINQVQVFMNRVTGSIGANIDGMIVIEQTNVDSTNPDSFNLTDVVVAQSGGTGAGLKIQAVDSSKPPRWIQISNSQFEAKTTGAAAGDYPIHLKNVRDFKCTNCYAHGGYHAVHIEGGPGPITFANSVIGNSQREAVYHNADVVTSLIGTTVSDASLETDNTYSDVYLTANSRGFSMIGGTVGAELLGFAGNDPKYGIEVVSGADEYRFSDVVCSDVPDSGCASGLTPAAAQVAFTDAIALGDSDWSAYGTIRPPSSYSANRTHTLPDETGTFCTTGSVCTGYQAGPLSGDVVTSGAAATIQANSVALGTDTTGNYALGDAEGGAATSGDSATSFFASGTIEAARLPDADDDATTKGILTLPNAQFDCTSGSCSIATGGIGSTELADTFSATTITSNLVGNVTGNADTATTASTGDSATAFFSSGTIEAARLPDADDDATTKGVATFPNAQFDCTSGSCSIATGGISATELGADSVSASELNASGVASELEAVLTHNNLQGLTTGDPHTQYALLAGRSGGQTLIGGTASGNDLTLQSTSHGTKGTLFLDDQVDLFDSFPDIGDGSNVYGLRWAPTFSVGGTIGTQSTARGFYLNPTVNFDDPTALDIAVHTYRSINGGGTFTVSGAATYAIVFEMFGANALLTSATASVNPPSSIVYRNQTRTLFSATSPGTATTGSAVGFSDEPIIENSGTGTFTLTELTGLKSIPSLRETAGTLNVGTYRGLDIPDLNDVETGSPAVTTAVSVDLAKQTLGTTNIGIRNAGSTVHTPTTQTIGANTDTIQPVASIVCLNSTANRDLSSNPQIADGVEGQVLMVVNCDSSTETIEINDGNGVQLNQNETATTAFNMDAGDSITLVYLTAGGASDWFETSRAED